MALKAGIFKIVMSAIHLVISNFTSNVYIGNIKMKILRFKFGYTIKQIVPIQYCSVSFFGNSGVAVF